MFANKVEFPEFYEVLYNIDILAYKKIYFCNFYLLTHYHILEIVINIQNLGSNLDYNQICDTSKYVIQICDTSKGVYKAL